MKPFDSIDRQQISPESNADIREQLGPILRRVHGLFDFHEQPDYKGIIAKFEICRNLGWQSNFADEYYKHCNKHCESIDSVSKRLSA